MFIKGTSGSGSGGPMGIYWGESTQSQDAAIHEAIKAAKAALPGKSLEWFEVIESRGGFKEGVPQFQMAVRIGYV